MTFTLDRQPCRCGHVFGSLKAHLIHADYLEPLPHDHPGEVGLVKVGDEWDVYTPPAPTKVVGDEPRERPARKASTDLVRTCKLCGAEFERPIKRGRPPTKCPDCR